MEQPFQFCLCLGTGVCSGLGSAGGTVRLQVWEGFSSLSNSMVLRKPPKALGVGEEHREALYKLIIPGYGSLPSTLEHGSRWKMGLKLAVTLEKLCATAGALCPTHLNSAKAQHLPFSGGS